RMDGLKPQVGSNANEDETLPRLGNTEPLRIQHGGTDAIAGILQRREHFKEHALRNTADKAGDILGYKSFRLDAAKQSHEVRKQIIGSLRGVAVPLHLPPERRTLA